MHYRPGPAGSHGHLRDQVRLALRGRAHPKIAIQKKKVLTWNRYLHDEILRLYKIYKRVFVAVSLLDVQQVTSTPSQLVAFLLFCTRDFFFVNTCVQ